MPEEIQVKVTINGESRQVPGDLSVSALLIRLGMVAGRVAIERNLDILPRDRWEDTRVVAGDRFEIVHLVGGG